MGASAVRFQEGCKIMKGLLLRLCTVFYQGQGEGEAGGKAAGLQALI